ncbi:histidine kinase [Nonomuraea sp. NPDC050786]|uniref:sensor histidine kinase n=1 Tax=Nonomuraea sp. NPDC050786 TaxID=3154840 RepID=UPI0033D634C0
MTPSIPRWVLRHPHWPLIALHVPLAVQVPVYTSLGTDGSPPSDPLPAILAAAAVLALQLRHSLAAARGERPRGWRWSFAALLLLTYAPLWMLNLNWISISIFLLASTAMVLRGRTMWALAAAQVAVYVVFQVIATVRTPGFSLWQVVILALYAVVVPSLFAAALVGGARLVRLLNELEAARTELAATAVGEERMRVSRDLHDLLGQSLSAISLKGDLALRLLARDATAARAEIESLTGVARDALHDVRAITRDQHTVSLRTEIDGAAALLGAAGVDTRLDVADLPSLPAPAQSALAWAIREGTTNLLRHSDAVSCTITLSRQRGRVRLEIANDGVRGGAGHGLRNGPQQGSGLAGVAERAEAAAGSSYAGVLDGRFRLSVEVPEEVT